MEVTLKRLLVFAILCFATNSVTAQINIPSDSINQALCKKWKFKAIIMGGQRLTNMNESVSYDFLVHGSVTRVTSNGKSEKGTWTFKPDLKIISLKFKKASLHVPFLSVDELIVSPGDGSDSGKNSLGVGTVLQPSYEN